jgi:hypothetical protein
VFDVVTYSWVELALAAIAWFLIGWLLWELGRPADSPFQPSLDHLSCGQCFWVTREQWLGLDQFPQNLPDQLVISAYCPAHNTFLHKRWKVKHLDDKGLPGYWDNDSDNYRDNYRGWEGD